MFNRLKMRFKDAKTLCTLIEGADQKAHANGEEKPGAEHFLLSALDLSDGSARRVFERLGADPDALHKAIQQQYRDALSAVGIDTELLDSEPAPFVSDKTFLSSQPSGEALVKDLHTLKSEDKSRPLLGAHVVWVAAQ